MPNQHKTTPKAVRMPAGLLPRVQAAVAESGETVNGFIVAAIEERLARLTAGSTTPAPAKPVAPPRKRREKTTPPSRKQECSHAYPDVRQVAGVSVCRICG